MITTLVFSIVFSLFAATLLGHSVFEWFVPSESFTYRSSDIMSIWLLMLAAAVIIVAIAAAVSTGNGIFIAIPIVIFLIASYIAAKIGRRKGLRIQEEYRGRGKDVLNLD
jgi:hypothetical protein